MRLSPPQHRVLRARSVNTAALSDSAALWFQTPILEVLAWALAVFSMAWIGNGLFGFEWATERPLRIAFDLFAMATIIVVMLISYSLRKRWNRLHVLTLCSIAGDQCSALAIDSIRSATPEQLWSFALLVVCGYALLRLLTWLMHARNKVERQRLAREMW
jgi:uncharacterized membrane protein YfcA